MQQKIKLQLKNSLNGNSITKKHNKILSNENS